MNVYIFIELFFMGMFFLAQDKYHSRYINLSFIVFLLLLTCHNGVFKDICDYQDYVAFFMRKTSKYGNLDINGAYELEWPYAIYCKILGVIGTYKYIYIITTAFLSLMPIYILCRRRCADTAFFFFLLMTMQHTYIYSAFFAAHRQMLATIFFLYAYYIINYVEFTRKSLVLFIGLLFLGLSSHSSSFFVVPLATVAYFIKLPQKSYIYFMIIGSFVIGLFSPLLFYGYMQDLMIYLSPFEEVDRSTHYYIDSVYEININRLSFFLPINFFAIACFYFYEKEELNNYSSRILLMAVVIFNLLNAVPLINRSLLFFWIIVFSQGLPRSINMDIRAKRVFGILGVVLILYVLRYVYSNPGYHLLPYRFFWE